MQTARQKTSSFPSLVVSIHDVSIVTRGIVEEMLEDLAGVGVSVTSLLVIPDHHHRGRIDGNERFSSWLRGAVASGHEVVLHGFSHFRTRKYGEGMATRLITRSYTAGEGEFFDLSFKEASDLLCEGRRALANCGVTAEGFIAPAWLLGGEAENAVREEGFAYTTRIGTVIDIRTGVSYPSRSMVYSVRAGWRRAMSLVWNEVLFWRLNNASLLRIGLHPPDWKHRTIRRHILKCIGLALRNREATTYRVWLAQTRSTSLSGQYGES
ncbi:MAG: polysaccharide deacetylase family protein [bacterium]